MRSKALPGWAHTLCTAAAALVFLLAYELVVYRVPVTEIFLPVSSWSDEVIYSKQLAAAVQYGAPQGYFGFNESHAAVGTYAAWGPAVFLVYALPGLLLRGQNAFLWCNLLFVVLGWTFFCPGRAAWLEAPAGLCCGAGRHERADPLCVLRHAGAAALCAHAGGAGLRHSGAAGQKPRRVGGAVCAVRRGHARAPL